MRILRKPELEAKVGLCERVIRDMEADGRFPRRVQITGRAVGWFEHEVDEYLAELAGSREAA